MTETRRTILLVHGRDRKPSSEDYLAISTSAMRAGIRRDYPDLLDNFGRIDIKLAYYGDLTATLLGDNGMYDEPLDVGDRRNALEALKAIDARKRFSLRDYDRIAGKTALKEMLADIGAPLSRLFGLGFWLIKRVSKDFAAYLDGGSDYATALRARVRDPLLDLLDRGESVMIVSHGTGSVVVYDVLWELSNDAQFVDRYGDIKIDHWVTLGSPLGNATVQKKIRGAQSARRFPTNVITWQNLSAEDDYTCHDKSVADDFQRMMKERVVSKVKDFRIFNLAVRYGRSNPHSSVGYYIHPRLTKIIVDWITAEG